MRNHQAMEETLKQHPAVFDAAVRDGWLWSGDQARRDADGYFFFVDRKKDLLGPLPGRAVAPGQGAGPARPGRGNA